MKRSSFIAIISIVGMASFMSNAQLSSLSGSKTNAIESTFKYANWNLQETRSSMRSATIGDKITFNWIAENEKKSVPDSIWVVESFQLRSSPLVLENDVVLEAEGDVRFLIAQYSIENIGQTEATSSIPILVDNKNRRFSPTPLHHKNQGLPKNVFRHDINSNIMPGFSKAFYVVYTLPKDAVPKHIEIYPISTQWWMHEDMRKGKHKGKIVELSVNRKR